MTSLPFLDTPIAAQEDHAAAIGQKGALLRRAVQLGAPVPDAFHVPLEVSRRIASGDPGALSTVSVALHALAGRTGHALDGGTPLCVAVRSAPLEGRPGALPTVLCAGASRAALPGLEARLGARSACLDARARYLRGLARAGGAVSPGSARGTRPSTPASSESELEREITALEERLAAGAGASAETEILHAIQVVARVSDSALVVQAMVLGSARGISGAGAASSRHPITGEPVVFGEIAWGRLGEDLSLGRGAGVSLRRAAAGRRGEESLEARAPNVLAELAGWLDRIERALDRVVDVELAVEDGRLAIVQVRPTVLTPRAEVRVAVDLAREGRWSRQEAIRRVSVASMARVGRIELAAEEELQRSGCLPIGTGLGASPGAASGVVAIDVGDAIARAARGERVVLVRSDASPEDAPAVRAAVAVATSSGGLTSHAAVMSRALGRPCAVSVSNLAVRDGEVIVGGTGRRLVPGDLVTVDGTRGRLLSGAAPTRWVSDDDAPTELATWARSAGGRAVVVEGSDGLAPAARALALGADGVWTGDAVVEGSGAVRTDLGVPIRWEGPDSPLPSSPAILVAPHLVAAARVAAAQDGSAS